MEKTEIIITAVFDFPPENIDKIIETSKDLIDGALDEVGCQAYSWTLDPYKPGRIWVMERNLNASGLLGGDALKYKISKQEPVYDETGVPRADFFSKD